MTESQHLLLVGGGHAHVEVLRRFAARPLRGWRITLLTREVLSPYSGMLPGVAAGLYRPEEALIDVGALAARAGAEFVHDRAVRLDPAAQLLHRAKGEPIRWDLVSINTGARPDTSRVPGAVTHALPLKPIDALLPRLETLVAAARPGQRLAVVGGGAAGVEMSFALAARLRGEGVELRLVAGAHGLLPGFPAKMRRLVAMELAARGIGLLSGDDVAEVVPEGLIFRRIPPLAADGVIWATGAAPAPWLARSGLKRDPQGFLRVEETLCAEGHARIFAAGDVASFPPQPLPKAGVFAVRQGPVLARNLRAAARGRRLLPYHPQQQWLVLLSLGDGRAIGTRNGMVFSGRWVWRWKDWIDRRFIQRYREPSS